MSRTHTDPRAEYERRLSHWRERIAALDRVNEQISYRTGADPQVLYDVISNSAGSSWMFQNRVPHILAGDYTPLSAVNIFVKDLGIVLDSARKMTFPLPLTAAAHQMFLGAAGAGLGYEDDSAVVKVYQAMSGIKLPGKKKKQT